jgi:hypothetical protein
VTERKLVSIKEAAAISGLSLASFKAGIARGHFPKPIMPYRKIHVQALCDAIDRLCEYMPHSIAQENSAYVFEDCLGEGFKSDEVSVIGRKNRQKEKCKNGRNQNLLLQR